jgi:hypothetical protein
MVPGGSEPLLLSTPSEWKQESRGNKGAGPLSTGWEQRVERVNPQVRGTSHGSSGRRVACSGFLPRWKAPWVRRIALLFAGVGGRRPWKLGGPAQVGAAGGAHRESGVRPVGASKRCRHRPAARPRRPLQPAEPRARDKRCPREHGWGSPTREQSPWSACAAKADLAPDPLLSAGATRRRVALLGPMSWWSATWCRGARPECKLGRVERHRDKRPRVLRSVRFRPRRSRRSTGLRLRGPRGSVGFWPYRGVLRGQPRACRPRFGRFEVVLADRVGCRSRRAASVGLAKAALRA